MSYLIGADKILSIYVYTHTLYIHTQIPYLNFNSGHSHKSLITDLFVNTTECQPLKASRELILLYFTDVHIKDVVKLVCVDKIPKLITSSFNVF